MKTKIKTIAAAVVMLAPGMAMATNGYFAHGYGMKSKGMAGVGIALPQDGLAAATNPAGMVLVGDRLDLGLDWFRPDRGAEIMSYKFDGNRSRDFFIPELGYNRMLSKDSSFGVSVYGNGGMNTNYASLPPPFPARGVNLEQLFIAPTYARKLNDANAIGVSVVFAYQRFEAYGMNGVDHSRGWGARVGWTGKLSDRVSVGATYATRTRMSRFNKYSDLFAEGGDFDIPSNYGFGVAFNATKALTLAADVQRINYGEIKSIANSGMNGGFGWRDMTVLKLGASYNYSDRLVLRGGASYGRQPIPSSETTFNVLAPGVMESHLTLGATWTLKSGDELSLAYMHALKKDVQGNMTPTGAADLHMSQDLIGIAYGHKF